MNNLDAIYDFILNELRKLTLNENFYFKPIKPKLSDLELIAIKLFDFSKIIFKILAVFGFMSK